MKYLITGTDGQLGGRVAANMLEAVDSSQLIFTVPDLNRLQKDKYDMWIKRGVTVKEANYDNASQLNEAFQGVQRMFFVSSIINGPLRIVQHQNVVDAAKKAGIDHVTYTSFLGADRTGYDQYVLPDHTATEGFLRESGLNYNIMRNNLYLENYLINSVLLANISDYKWITPAGEGKATYIAKDDSGRVGSALLQGKGALNTAYDVTGGESITQREIVRLIADASGLPFTYIPVSPDKFFDYLDSIHIPRTTDGDYSQSPVPFCGNDMVTNEYGVRDGLMDIVTDNVEKLTGQKALCAADLIEKYSFVWKEKVGTYWDLQKYM
ncbi:MAG: NmrA family NAD(P)-binding protein [Anaerofustis sp.]